MESNTTPAGQPQQLTRQQLKDLERKELTPIQRFFELIIMILPLACGLIAIGEYMLIPDKGRNANPGVYLTCLIILPERTYANDCHVVDLPDEQQFEIVL